MGLRARVTGVNARMRLGAYVLLLHVTAGVWLFAVARARTDAALLRVGSLVMAYADAMHQQEPRTVVLNGAQLQLSVGATTRSVGAVLDHFERRCRARSGGFGDQLRAALVTSKPAASGTSADVAVLDGILRVDEGVRGAVACLDVGNAHLSMQDLVQRVRRMTETGDLSQLGHLRFVTAERGAQRTVFAAMWSEGPLDIRHMFPTDRDAPGTDIAGVPRPHRGRRVLSAWEHGQDKALNAYVVNDVTPTKVKAAYLSLLATAGVTWHGGTRALADGIIAQHGERWFAVAFSTAEPGSTWVTISSLSEATNAIATR